MKIRITVLLILLITITAFAKDKVTLEADKITSIDNTTSVAEGNVIVLYKDITLTADKIKFNRQTNEIEAFGNVTLIENETNFNASYIFLDMDNKTGKFKDSSGFYPPYTFIKAEYIEKISENRFILTNSQITSCDGETPDWSIKSRTAKFDKGEYVYVTHATFRLKDVPILYSPYFTWPVKEKRESGFLIPEFGTASSKGEFISPRYFWDIDVDKDATFGINYFSKIGTQYLAEFRYSKSKKENIYISGEYIHHTESETDKIDRWKFVNTSNIFLAKNLELKFDTNYVSDFRYERDFDDYSMYIDEDTDDDDDTTNKYINEIRLNYYTDIANISIRYRDDMEYADVTGGYKQSHIIRSPQLIIEKNNLSLGFLKFDYKADYNKLVSKTRYFYFADDTHDEDRTVDNNSHYERIHSRLKLYKPINAIIGTFTPAYTQYATKWFNMDSTYQVDNFQETSAASIRQDGDTIDRLIYKINLGFTFNEIYKRYKHFKHTIYNTYSYTFVPEVIQGNIPDLIEEDDIEARELHSFKMKNYFKGDTWSSKLEFTQQYDELLKENKFLPLRTKLKISLWDLLKEELDFEQDHYDNYTPYLKNKFSITFDKIYLSTEYIYDEDITSDDNNNITGTIGGKLYNFDIFISQTASMSSKNLALHPLYKYKNKTFKTEIKYTSGCWGLGINYKYKNYIKITNSGDNRESEHIYFLYVELKGLGSTDQQIFSNDTNF